MLPHDLRWRVAINRTVQDCCLAIDSILIVGLHNKPRRHWKDKRDNEKQKARRVELKKSFCVCLSAWGCSEHFLGICLNAMIDNVTSTLHIF